MTQGVEEFLASRPDVYQREGNFVTVRAPKRKLGDELDPVPYDRQSHLRLNAGQWPIWLAQQRHLFMIAGSQGGKSYLGPLWMWRHIENTTKRYPDTVTEYAIVGHTLQNITYSQVGIGRMAQYLWEAHGHLWAERGMTQEDIVNMRGLFIDLRKVGIPAIIYTGSEKHMHRLQGTHLNAIWIDEGGLFKSEAAYFETISRLANNGQVLMTTTPYIEGLWLKDRVEAAKEGDPEMLVVRYPSLVNRYFPLSEWNNKMKELPAPYFNMRHRAMFELPMGLVYPNVTVCPPFNIPRNWERMLVVDPTQGGPDPIAGLWVAIDPNPPYSWYAYREYYKACRPNVSAWKKGQTETHQPWDLMEEIREASRYERYVPPVFDASGEVMQDGYFEPTDDYERLSRIFYDPAQTWAGTWLEEHFPDALVFKPDKSKNAGIVDTGSMLQRGDDGGLVIFESLANWLWERAHYVYPTNVYGETVSADPVKHDDHLMDCTRYIVRQCPESWETAGFSIGGWKGVS